VDIDFKFGTWIDRINKCYRMDDKPSLKRAWSRSREPFKFRWAPTISLERLQLQSSNFVHTYRLY